MPLAMDPKKKKSQTLNFITTNMTTNDAGCGSVKKENMSTTRKTINKTFLLLKNNLKSMRIP